jgi:tetrahydromethanopterin S-methyltransferase subunit G
MHLMRESWTDARLDDFVVNVDKRFDSVDKRFDSVDKRFDSVDRKFDAVDKRFDKVDKRLDGIEGDLKAMQRVMVQGTIALTSAIVAGFAAIVGLLATQL